MYKIQGWKTPEKYSKKSGKLTEPKVIAINEETINVFLENKEAAQLYYMECIEVVNEKNASMTAEQVNDKLTKKQVVSASDDIHDLKVENKDLKDRLEKLEALINDMSANKPKLTVIEGGNTDTNNKDEGSTDKGNIDSDLEELRGKYNLLSGEPANKNWKKETLIKKIEEIKNSQN